MGPRKWKLNESLSAGFDKVQYWRILKFAWKNTKVLLQLMIWLYWSFIAENIANSGRNNDRGFDKQEQLNLLNRSQETCVIVSQF